MHYFKIEIGYGDAPLSRNEPLYPVLKSLKLMN